MADKAAKGRSPDFSGGKGPRCKLTIEQARETYALRKQGLTVQQLMDKYSISRASMKSLLRVDSYKESPNA